MHGSHLNDSGTEVAVSENNLLDGRLLRLILAEPARQNCQRRLAAALEFDFHGCLQVIDIPDGDAAHGLPRFDLDGLGILEITLIVVQRPEPEGIVALRCREQIDRGDNRLDIRPIRHEKVAHEYFLLPDGAR